MYGLRRDGIGASLTDSGSFLTIAGTGDIQPVAAIGEAMVGEHGVAPISSRPLDTAAFGIPAVVGNFNDWTPGAHVRRRRSNGTRSESVTVPAGSSVHFRYLGENGLWFDDPDADTITDTGSVVQLPPLT
jgi:hypothetical protein